MAPHFVTLERSLVHISKIRMKCQSESPKFLKFLTRGLAAGNSTEFDLNSTNFKVQFLVMDASDETDLFCKTATISFDMTPALIKGP